MSHERCRCDFTDGPKDCACPCCGAGSGEPCRHGDELLALRDALRGLPCMFVWQASRGSPIRYVLACDNPVHGLPEHAWCPSCRARAALAGSSGGATPAPSGTKHRDDGQGFRIPGSES